jgi:hypothetical protein
MSRKQRPREETAYLTEPDRLVIVARRREKKISQAELARLCDATPAAMSLLLSTPIPAGKTRGCRFLAKLQSALDLAPTARRPAILPADEQRRIDRVVATLRFGDPEQYDAWLRLGELQADRAKK